MVIKVILLLVFFAVMLGIGFYSRKHATDVNGFVLGGRSVGPWLIRICIWNVLFFSGCICRICRTVRLQIRTCFHLDWNCNAVLGSLLAWVVLGRRTRIMTKHLKSMTMPDFFGKRYGSKSLRVAASMIAFIFLIPYTASVYNGLSYLFGMAFDIDFRICVVVMAVLTGVYVIVGGYMATALNDLIQGIIMLFGIVAVIAAVLSGHGGFLAAVKELAHVPSDVMPGAYASFFGPDPLNLLGVVILTSLGTWGLPQMIQKFYAIKDEKAVHTGTIISTLFAVVVSGGCYFLGGFSQISGVTKAADGSVAYDTIIPTMLSSLPDILIGIVIVLVLSASMSTLSSLVLTSSSTLTLDFIKPLFVKDMSEKKQLIWMRILLAFFIIISVVIALDPPAFIAQLMGISWGALAGAFLAPFLYGLYWKRVTKAAVWASFIAGVGITVSNMFINYIASPINAGALAMLAGLIVVPVVSVITKKPDEAIVDGIFNCLDEKVMVEQKMALPEEDEE